MVVVRPQFADFLAGFVFGIVSHVIFFFARWIVSFVAERERHILPGGGNRLFEEILLRGLCG